VIPSIHDLTLLENCLDLLSAFYKLHFSIQMKQFIVKIGTDYCNTMLNEVKR
jgi:hypothetical protein